MLYIHDSKLNVSLFSGLAAKTAQKEEFMFQNVAHRPTVYKTGARHTYRAQWGHHLFLFCISIFIYGFMDIWIYFTCEFRGVS